MRNYNAHDIQDWVQDYISDFQYLIVAHTTYRPKNKSFLSIEKALRTNSSKLEDSLKYVSRNLYENDPYLPFKNREKFGLHPRHDAFQRDDWECSIVIHTRNAQRRLFTRMEKRTQTKQQRLGLQHSRAS